MAALNNKYTGGFNPTQYSKSITFSDSTKLTAEQKLLFVNAVASAASKVLTLDLVDGQTMVIANVGGTNAFTVKNVSGDTGTSLAAGKVAYVCASTTADASKVYVLN